MTWSLLCPSSEPSFHERCQGGFDAIANIRGEVFFFKGKKKLKKNTLIVVDIKTVLSNTLSNPPHQLQCFWTNSSFALFSRKGKHFWRTKHDGSLVSFNPTKIKNFWMGLPPGMNKIDAVYERKSDSRIIFFIGRKLSACMSFCVTLAAVSQNKRCEQGLFLKVVVLRGR